MKKSKWLLALTVSLIMVLLAACGQQTQQQPAAPSQSEDTASSTDSSGQQTPQQQGPGKKVADKEPYLIGVSEPLTGPANVLGIPVTEAAKMAAEYINENGGVDGHPIKLLIEDDTSKPDVAITRVRKLIEQGVYGIIGPNQGSNTLAISPVIKEAGVPILAFNNTISITKQGNPYIFRSQTNDETNVRAAILFLKRKHNAQKIGVLYSGDAYGTDAYNALVEAAKEAGLAVDIVAVEKFEYTATDITPQWAKIQAANPDAVVLWGSGTSIAVAMRNAEQLGVKVPIIGGQGLANNAIIEAAGSAAEGMYAIGLIDPTTITSTQEALYERLKAKYGPDHQISTFDVIGWDAVHIYAEALRISGGDKAKFVQALESISALELAAGTYGFSPVDHDALGLDSVAIMQVQSGKFVGIQKGVQ